MNQIPVVTYVVLEHELEYLFTPDAMLAELVEDDGSWVNAARRLATRTGQTLDPNLIDTPNVYTMWASYGSTAVAVVVYETVSALPTPEGEWRPLDKPVGWTNPVEHPVFYAISSIKRTD